MANPNRFFLGTSTARETHDLLRALVAGTLLSPPRRLPARLLRSPVAFTDGIRRTMSSDERARVATKAGWFADARHEAGMMFDTHRGGRAHLCALRRRARPTGSNFGATHPAVQARAAMGRLFLDAIAQLRGTADAPRTPGGPAAAPATAADHPESTPPPARRPGRSPRRDRPARRPPSAPQPDGPCGGGAHGPVMATVYCGGHRRGGHDAATSGTHVERTRGRTTAAGAAGLAAIAGLAWAPGTCRRRWAAG